MNKAMFHVIVEHLKIKPEYVDPMWLKLTTDATYYAIEKEYGLKDNTLSQQFRRYNKVVELYESLKALDT